MEENNGWLIVFEGPNDSGKSTIMTLFIDFLKQNGYVKHGRNMLITREPGSNHRQFTKEIRRFILNYEEEISDITRLYLYLADRYEHITKVVNPALEDGKIVISDRFWYSMYVYQRMVQKLFDDYPEVYTSFMNKVDMPTVDHLFIILSNEPHNRKSYDDTHERVLKERKSIIKHYYNIHKLASLLPEHKEEYGVRNTLCIDNNKEMKNHEIADKLEDTFEWMAEEELGLCK